MNPQNLDPSQNVETNQPNSAAQPLSNQPSNAQEPANSQSPAGSQPQIVYMARPMEPERVHVSQAAMEKHRQSKQKYPQLNLSEGEFVISAVDRHPIGLLQIWAAVGLVIVALTALFALVASGIFTSDSAGSQTTLSGAILSIPLLLLGLLALLFGFIAASIYNANKFFLTNESVIQQIQTSLFSKREQTVSLANIEDASFSQDGIMTHLFNYGLIRLSTEGDETTYRFSYASNPQKQIATLNNAVEAFKNGRPVTGED